LCVCCNAEELIALERQDKEEKRQALLKQQEAQQRLFHQPLAGLLTGWLRDEVSTGGYVGTPRMLDRMFAAAVDRQHLGMDGGADNGVAEKTRDQKREERERRRLLGEVVNEDGVSESDRLGKYTSYHSWINQAPEWLGSTKPGKLFEGLLVMTGRCSAVVIEGAILQMVLEGGASRSLLAQNPMVKTAALADAIAAAEEMAARGGGGSAAVEEAPEDQAEEEEEEEEERSRGLTQARRIALEGEAERRSATEAEAAGEVAAAAAKASAEEKVGGGEEASQDDSDSDSG